MAANKHTILAGCVNLDESINLRHEAPRDKDFQDSVVLVWWDPGNSIGGFHRLGHESNPEGNKVALWTNITTPTGIFKRTQSKPLRKKDILPSGGFGSGDDTCTVEFKNGQHIWNIEEPDEELKLHIVHKDTGPHVDCYPKRAITDTFAAGHLDIPGVVTGTMTHKGETYEIKNGFSIRDRGWGVRTWNRAVLSHRWVAGSAGPDFGVVIVAWHGADDSYSKFGWVVSNNMVKAAKSIDILAYKEDDSLTNRGGKTQIELVDGKSYVIEWKPVSKAFVTWHHDLAVVDRLCSFKAFETTEGKEYHGFGDFENSSNMHHGSRKPSFVIDAVIETGFTST
ncbi:uncharacterized protein E0L32_006671 [Thyridium curvatum]|uniref:Uncharacterized protein n=1 Tax=Thyridium curvatum TaxID=1093900 RepID=A0A507B6W6_9PEZI|nr:uncharacterized protein E0L32_006671 [Thyridium curvatum]TPX12791.1 hypothetical protein E0L32_006671 [Thyridium curvatum]